MDAGYGAETDLRTNITMLGLSYVAGTRLSAVSAYETELGW
jgi:hypothetical protein